MNSFDSKEDKEIPVNPTWGYMFPDHEAKIIGPAEDFEVSRKVGSFYPYKEE